jgi:hypothetical protein
MIIAYDVSRGYVRQSLKVIKVLYFQPFLFHQFLYIRRYFVYVFKYRMSSCFLRAASAINKIVAFEYLAADVSFKLNFDALEKKTTFTVFCQCGFIPCCETQTSVFPYAPLDRCIPWTIFYSLCCLRCCNRIWDLFIALFIL